MKRLLQSFMLGLVSTSVLYYEAVAISDKKIIAKAEALLSSPEARLQQEIDMRDYVNFASVAAESKYDKETRACAEWLRDWLSNRLGMEDAALYESGYRHPVVVASSSNDLSKPAIVIYGIVDIEALPLFTPSSESHVHSATPNSAVTVCTMMFVIIL